MAGVLMFGDDRQPAIRHAIGLPLPDPVAYAELDDARYVFAGLLDVPRLRALGEFEVIPFDDLGLVDALGAGQPLPAAFRHVVANGCEQIGLRDAVVPADFPLELAEFLRGRGVELRPDGALFDLRRRSKTPVQLDGIRRAMRAAELAMGHVRDRLRGGGDLTAEGLRAEARRIFVDNDCVPHDMLVVAAGGYGADPHDQGE